MSTLGEIIDTNLLDINYIVFTFFFCIHKNYVLLCRVGIIFISQQM